MAGPRDTVPEAQGGWHVQAEASQRRLLYGHTGFHHPTERTCSVPGHLALGQAWKLSGVGRMYCGSLRRLPPVPTQHSCSRSPSGTGRHGRPILALAIDNKEGTERVPNLPRVTQHISGRDRSPH